MQNNKLNTVVNEINEFIKNKVSLLLNDLLIQSNEYEETKAHILKLPFIQQIISELVVSQLSDHGQLSEVVDYSKIKIYINSEGLQRLAELGLPIDHGEWKKDYSFTSDFSAEEIEVIASNGFLFDVIHQDVKAFYKAQNENPNYSVKNTSCSGSSSTSPITVPSNFETSAASYAGFYMYQEMLDELDDMAAQYPNLITVKSPISTFLTWEGRPIYHVKISDNPST